MKYLPILSIVVFAFVLSFGCAKKDKETSVQVTGSSTPQNVSEISNVQVRDGIVPNFAFTDLNGKATTFDAFKGQITFVNFWATWCGPCKIELPDLITLSKEYEAKNVKFIGISTDRGGDVIADVRSFIQKAGIPYQIVISNEDIEEAFGNIHSIPTSFIIDANGKILKSIIGVRSKQVLGEEIEKALSVVS